MRSPLPLQAVLVPTYLVYSTLYRNVSSESTTCSISMNVGPFDVNIDLFDVIPAVRVDHRVLYFTVNFRHPSTMLLVDGKFHRNSEEFIKCM